MFRGSLGGLEKHADVWKPCGCLCDLKDVWWIPWTFARSHECMENNGCLEGHMFVRHHGWVSEDVRFERRCGSLEYHRDVSHNMNE